jgi:hypothetical protein
VKVKMSKGNEVSSEAVEKLEAGKGWLGKE